MPISNSILCAYCGTIFTPKYRQRYCSDSCRREAAKKRFKDIHGISQTTANRHKWGAAGLCYMCGAVATYGNGHRYCNKHWKKKNQRGSNTAKSLRQLILKEYGGKCVCCNESRPEFLALDHIQGGSSNKPPAIKIRRDNHYRRVKKEGFPKNTYRLLCHNCNQSRGAYGYCPHERERARINFMPNALTAA